MQRLHSIANRTFNYFFPGLSLMPVPCYVFRVMEPSISLSISILTQESLRKKEIFCNKVFWRALPGTCFYKSVWLVSICKIQAEVPSVRPISVTANLIGAILKREKIDIAEVHTGVAILSSPSSCTMASSLFSPLSLPHKPRSRCNVGWH